MRGFAGPRSLNWDNFADAWSDAGLGRSSGRALIIAVAVVPLSLLLATLAGYGLAILRPPGGRTLRAVFLIGLAIPLEVIVDPAVLHARDVGLTNSYTVGHPRRGGVVHAVRHAVDDDQLRGAAARS